ncbi:hypothetical protein D3C76_365760 [compost metagenome]
MGAAGTAAGCLATGGQRRLAVDAHPARAQRRGRRRRRAGAQRRDLDPPGHQWLACRAGLRHRWQHRPGAGLHHRPVELGRTPARQLGADDPQRAAPGADPAGDPVVRYRRVGKDLFGRAGHAVPDLPEHLPRHPQRRPGAGGDGAQLWLVRLQPVPPGDPARGIAFDPGRRALCPGLHVADPDRCRNDFGQCRHRLPGDERP